jgi:superoxide dismutase
MSIVHSSGAVADPCCAGSRGASFGTPCYYICVTLNLEQSNAQIVCIRADSQQLRLKKCLSAVVTRLRHAGHVNHDIFWTNLAPEKVRGWRGTLHL